MSSSGLPDLEGQAPQSRPDWARAQADRLASDESSDSGMPDLMESVPDDRPAPSAWARAPGEGSPSEADFAAPSVWETTYARGAVGSVSETDSDSPNDWGTDPGSASDASEDNGYGAPFGSPSRWVHPRGLGATPTPSSRHAEQTTALQRLRPPWTTHARPGTFPAHVHSAPGSVTARRLQLPSDAPSFNGAADAEHGSYSHGTHDVDADGLDSLERHRRASLPTMGPGNHGLGVLGRGAHSERVAAAVEAQRARLAESPSDPNGNGQSGNQTGEHQAEADADNPGDTPAFGRS